MIYDLQGHANMSPVVGMLYSAVKENSHRLKCITDGMSQEEVDYRGPDHKSNSTAQLIDDDLDKVVIFGHENEKQATIRWGIWHMADHSRYHQAHINQIRKWFSTQSLEL